MTQESAQSMAWMAAVVTLHDHLLIEMWDGVYRDLARQWCRLEGRESDTITVTVAVNASSLPPSEPIFHFHEDMEEER